MATEEFTVEKDTGYVPQATADMKAGQIDEIERQAKAQVVSAKVSGDTTEKAKAAAAGTDATGVNGEAKVYGDIITNALGMGNLASAAEAIGTRLKDHSQMKGNAPSGAAQHAAQHGEGHISHNTAAKTATVGATPTHIENDIKSASRAPGIYRAPASQDKFGAGQKPDMSHVGISERVGLTSASLQGEKGSGNLATWAKKPFESQKVGSVAKNTKELELGQDKKQELASTAELSKNVTFSKENASQLALDSVKVAREKQQAMFRSAELTPGLGGGPKFNSAPYQARDEESKSA